MTRPTPTAPYSETNSKTTLRLAYWTATWLLTTALLAFGPKLLWDFNTPLTVAALILNLAVGFGMILANKRHLRGLDEMHRKIFLDAAAVTLGVGLVCSLSYEMMHAVKLIAFEPQISHVVMLMSLIFLGAMIAGHRQYQ